METLRWENGTLYFLDQTLLPHETRYLSLTDYRAVIEAIKRLAVRGAPAIGAAGAYAVVLAAVAAAREGREGFAARVRAAAAEIAQARPTAVNLRWAVARQLRVLDIAAGEEPEKVVARLVAEAARICAADAAANRAMGAYGAALLPPGARVLTHCNAGALATCGYGTALGVVRAAHAAGKIKMVYADETRPLLQGARLTVFELQQDGIPVTLITDGMAGYLMAKKGIDAVIVGADRIAANGDVANKIGTYSLAVLARHHGVPFYVAAPLSTIDAAASDGSAIPIEERDAAEVTSFAGVAVAPPGTRVWNPAFDVTPADLVSAIITEKGVFYPPYNFKDNQEVLPIG
ncbi:methylthioribose-1-phosphate isomerase [Thermodesulfitimonas autotrophica]|uniref:Methylthioribose-1-phosphate isomerase n=1 Tax=Thermodesulfitimonas autotrophica TaxID=1894989 RepID=A0A3N5BF09_9THEO|nr:S-methyl-5-thioribose-1-phosphate isomerase [Thermodesulfitimonas autotrophica]RPF42611.1 methylthioribose-1-phosphate isomerase [Thermodesulfitimonas autotrophica]